MRHSSGEPGGPRLQGRLSYRPHVVSRGDGRRTTQNPTSKTQSYLMGVSGASTRGMGFFPLSRDTYYQEPAVGVVQLQEPSVDTSKCWGRLRSAPRQTHRRGDDESRSEDWAAAQQQGRNHKYERGTSGDRRDFCLTNKTENSPSMGVSAKNQGNDQAGKKSWSRQSSPRQLRGFAALEHKFGGSDGNYEQDGSSQRDDRGHTGATALPSPSHSRPWARSSGWRITKELSPSLQGSALSKTSLQASNKAVTSGDVHDHSREDFGAESRTLGGFDQGTAREVVERAAPTLAESCAFNQVLADSLTKEHTDTSNLTQDTWEALARAEALAWREVEAARNGAAAERAARATAEAALLKARASLRDTDERLQESLNNGPKAALAALLAEREAAEVEAATAVALAEAAAVEAAHALEEKRGEELWLSKKERDQVQETLESERSDSEKKMKGLRVALTKARGDALTCRARASTLQQRLDQADVSGLQATLVSLAADKATAQSRAAHLEAKLAQVTGEIRRRAHASRTAVATVNDRLSCAETRASAAEARVEAVVRHLTVSERRRREAERRAATKSSGNSKTEVERTFAIEADAGSIEQIEARQEARADGVVESGVCERAHAAVEVPVGMRGRAEICRERRKLGEEWLGCRSSPLGTVRKMASDQSRSTEGDASRIGDRMLSSRCEVRKASSSVTLVDASRQQHQQRSGTAATENDVNATEAPAEVVGAESLEKEGFLLKEGTGGSLSEVQAARKSVADAKQEAATMRTAADRAKEQAAKTATEAEIEKERAVEELERLKQELRDTQEETYALGWALARIDVTGDEEKTGTGAEVDNEQASTLHDENDTVEPGDPEGKSDEDLPDSAIIHTTEASRRDKMQYVQCQPRKNGASFPVRMAEKSATTFSGVLAASSTSACTWVTDPEQADGEQTGVADVGVSYSIYDVSSGQRATNRGVYTAEGDQELPLQHHEPPQVRSPAAKLSPEAAITETCDPTQDNGEVRVTSIRTTPSRRTPEREIGELEEIVSGSERQHAFFRERGNRRLDALKLAFVQEEEEAGAQIALMTLLEEKSRTEMRASELELHLADMTAVAEVARSEAVRLKVYIEESLKQPFATNLEGHPRGQELHETGAAVAGPGDACRDPHQSAPPASGTHPGGTIPATDAPAGTPSPSSMSLLLAEVEERADSAELKLQVARDGSHAAVEECKRLGRRLDEALKVKEAEAQGKRLAQARIAELEKGIENGDQEQVRMRERAESRLACFRAAIEQEELEADGKAALACLLAEKVELVARTVDLENRLHKAESATAAAISRAAALTEENSGRKSAPPPAASGVDIAIAVDSDAEVDASREVAAAPPASATNRPTAARELEIETAERHASMIRQAEFTATQSMTEVSRLRHELEIVQAEQAGVIAAAAEERKESEERILKLEQAIEDTKREYFRRRERAEARLETLRAAFDQEEKENDSQTTFAILLEEKGRAERRADEATAAARESGLETKRIQERVDEVILACEQETAALRTNMERQTAEIVIAEIDAKVDEALGAPRNKETVQKEATPIERTSEHSDLVAEILRKFDLACDVVKIAETKALTAKPETDQVRDEVPAATPSGPSEGNDCKESSTIKVTAAKETAANEPPLRVPETALQMAKDDVERLRRELERAQAAEAAGQAAAEEDKGESIRKIARLEDCLREAVEEHQSSRAQAGSELEQLREEVARSESACCIIREESKASAAEREAGAKSAAEAAAAAAVARVAAEQGRRLEQSKEELRVAEGAVAEATGEVEVLRGKLARTADLASASKVQRDAAEKRMAELQRALEVATRDHVAFREVAQERLDKIRASLERESRENGRQAALTALLHEKTDIEQRATADFLAANEVRSDLEHRLAVGTAALEAAEKKLKALEVGGDLSKVGNSNQDLKEAVTEISGATAAPGEPEIGGTAGGGDIDVDAQAKPARINDKQDSPVLPASDVQQPKPSLGNLQDAANSESKVCKAEAQAAEPTRESLRSEPSRVQESEAAAAAAAAAEAEAEAEAVSVAFEARRVAEEKVSELEGVIQKAEQERERSRALAEARLRKVERQLGEEEQESGLEIAMVALLQEKTEAEARALEVERRLDEACASVIRVEARATALEGELIVARSEGAAENEKTARQQGETTRKSQAEATQAAELATAQESLLQDANKALRTTREGVNKLHEERGQALARERDASAAVEKERCAAREKIIELEGSITKSGQEHALLQERTAGRLELFRLAVEAEERENDPQAALSELLQQKARAEDHAAELVQAVVDIRTDLEHKLQCANDALRVAETRATSLESAVEATEVKAAATVAAAATATAVAVEAELSRERSFHSERLRTITERQAGRLDAVEEIASVKEEEAEHWKGQAGQARAEGMAAREEATAARSRISELEGAMEDSRREHETFRERTEMRLESLKLAVEEEELEEGAQVALSCLLNESSKAQAEVVDLRVQLFQACELVRAKETDLDALAAELERVQGLNSELSKSSTVVAPTPPPAEVLLSRERLEAGLEGLRVVVEEEESGMQASLAVLLEEKWQLESRVGKLERQLKEAHEALCRTADNAAKTRSKPRPSTAKAEGNATVDGATATDTERALSEALEAMEDLETRCASAQSRELETTHEAALRIRELVRELEEANDHGAKAALVALLEESASRSSRAIAATARAPYLRGGADDNRVGEGEGDDVSCGKISRFGIKSERGDDRASTSGSEEDDADRAAMRSEGGTILGVLAQRDALLREKERLEMKAEDMLYIQHDQAYRRAIDVGRYELSIDILEGNLEDEREKLAESVQFRSEDDKELQDRFKAMCQRAKNAEFAKRRANEQLAELQDQLVLACQAFSDGGDGISSSQDLEERALLSNMRRTAAVEQGGVLLPPTWSSASMEVIGASVVPVMSPESPLSPTATPAFEKKVEGTGAEMYDSGMPKEWTARESHSVALWTGDSNEIPAAAAAAVDDEAIDEWPGNIDKLKEGVVTEDHLAHFEGALERYGDAPPPPSPLSASPVVAASKSAPIPDAIDKAEAKVSRVAVGRVNDRVANDCSAVCVDDESGGVVEGSPILPSAATGHSGPSCKSIAEKSIRDGPRGSQALAREADFGSGWDAAVAETSGRGDVLQLPPPFAHKTPSAFVRWTPTYDNETVEGRVGEKLGVEEANSESRRGAAATKNSSEQCCAASAFPTPTTAATAHPAPPIRDFDADGQARGSLHASVEGMEKLVGRGDSEAAAQDKRSQSKSSIINQECSSVTPPQRPERRKERVISIPQSKSETHANARSADSRGTRQSSKPTSSEARRPSSTSGLVTSSRGHPTPVSGNPHGSAASELSKPEEPATAVAAKFGEVNKGGSSVQVSASEERVRRRCGSESSSRSSDPGETIGDTLASDVVAEAGPDLCANARSTEDGNPLRVDTLPFSFGRRRRSSDAFFGLPRLSSMHSTSRHQKRGPPRNSVQTVVVEVIDRSENSRRSSSPESQGFKIKLDRAEGVVLGKGKNSQGWRIERPEYQPPSLEPQDDHVPTKARSREEGRIRKENQPTTKAGEVRGAAKDTAVADAKAANSSEAIDTAAAAATEATAATDKGSRTGQTEQPHSISPSPESRGGTVVIEAGGRARDRGTGQDLSLAKKVAVMAMAEGSTRERREEHVDFPGSRFSSLATGRDSVGSGRETSPAQGLQWSEHHPTGGLSFSWPPAEHNDCGVVGESAFPFQAGTGGKNAFPSPAGNAETRSIGGSNDDESGRSGQNTEAEAVRGGSYRRERGRSTGLLSSLRRAVTNTTTRNGKKRASKLVRSESPGARR